MLTKCWLTKQQQQQLVNKIIVKLITSFHNIVEIGLHKIKQEFINLDVFSGSLNVGFYMLKEC